MKRYYSIEWPDVRGPHHFNLGLLHIALFDKQAGAGVDCDGVIVEDVTQRVTLAEARLAGRFGSEAGRPHAALIDDGSYTYDPEHETYRCNQCGTIFEAGEDDPDQVKEMHEAICDQIIEANERAAWARERNPKDPRDQGGLISSGW